MLVGRASIRSVVWLWRMALSFLVRKSSQVMSVCVDILVVYLCLNKKSRRRTGCSSCLNLVLSLFG